MKRAALGLITLLALLGCRKTVASPAPIPSASVAPSPGPVDAGVVASETVDAAVDAAVEPGPYAELPDVTGDEGDGIGSDRVVGFSSDDRYIGFGVSTCDPCPEQFHFRGPGVPALDFAYFYDPGTDDDEATHAAREKANDAKVEATLARLGASKVKDYRVLRGPFPFPDLVFAAKSSRSAQGGVTLDVGAHVVGEEPVFPIHIPLGMHPISHSSGIPKEVVLELMHDARLGYLNVTKDGHDIGAVGIARGDYWWESGATARMPTTAFVAQVYDATGRKRLAAGNVAGAEELFTKARALKITKPMR